MAVARTPDRPIQVIALGQWQAVGADGLKAGTSECIPKPIDTNNLMIVFVQWLPGAATATRPPTASR